MRKITRSLALLVLTAGVAMAGVARADVTGAGSSFAFPIVSKWAADYKKLGGDQVNYQSVGSGAGIAQIKAGTVDFGATDKPLDSKELAAAGLAQFPVIIGGIVPVVNIPGIRSGQLRFSGPVLGAIYLGQIKTWNDPAIAKLNPGVRLPASQITVVHRSDSSGTSFNFTHFLSQVNAQWKASVGEGTSV